MHILNDADPNSCWTSLYKLILSISDTLCPIIDLKIRDNTAEYLNNELLELQLDRDYFNNKADLTGDPGDSVADCLTRKACIKVRKANSKHCQHQAELLKHNHHKPEDQCLC